MGLLVLKCQRKLERKCLKVELVKEILFMGRNTLKNLKKRCLLQRKVNIAEKIVGIMEGMHQKKQKEGYLKLLKEEI